MIRHESGFRQSTRSAVVASQINEGIASVRKELAFPEVKPKNEGLTNKILASLPASDSDD
jgi:hypothetical protein